MSILIGRRGTLLGNRVTLKSTDTGDEALMTPEEWAAFVRRVKSGHLDHIAAAFSLAPTGERPRDLSDVLAARIAADNAARTYDVGAHPLNESGIPGQKHLSEGNVLPTGSGWPDPDARRRPPPSTRHYLSAGWKGVGPGSCGAECACGVGFGGFDTLNEAAELVTQHAVSANERERLLNIRGGEAR